jgi:site-specific DNA-methyltransferase (adenine-specific)
MKKIEIGNAILYLGDCAEILPTLGQFDALVTDPPYGIDYDPKTHKNYDGSDNNLEKIINDEKEMDLTFLFKVNCQKIVWGAENFYKQLPHRGRWICWHKRSDTTKPNSMFSGDFELAWMDKDNGFYKYFQLVHGGVINADSIKGNNEKRYHPTQKPIKLMEFCISLLNENNVICDPFMGSGTTGIASVNMKKQFIGIEKDQKYFDIACKRIEDAQRQVTLF